MSAAFAEFAARCSHHIAPEVPRRRGNVVAVEVSRPSPRCTLRLPANWGPGAPSAGRWLFSGGDALVFGYCLENSCPLWPADLESR